MSAGAGDGGAGTPPGCRVSSARARSARSPDATSRYTGTPSARSSAAGADAGYTVLTTRGTPASLAAAAVRAAPVTSAAAGASNPGNRADQ